MREHRISSGASRLIFCSFLMALAQPVVHVAAASVQAPVHVRSTATPAPKFVPQPNYEYAWLVPTRPHDARRIHLAVGVFEEYTSFTGLLPEMNITLRNPRTGVSKDYTMAFNTTLNGLPIKCSNDKIIAHKRFCGSLPRDIVPGKTMLALLYWREAFPSLPSLRGTDTIVTLQP